MRISLIIVGRSRFDVEYNMDKMQSTQLQLAKKIADLFASLPQVEAIALAGSRGNGAGTMDSSSDIDLYVYTRGDIPLEARRAIVERTGGATRSNFNLNYWGAGDFWVNAPTGIEMDIIYFGTTWMEDQISRVVERHQASLGYTTCFWYTIRQSILFFDSQTWFANLQQQCSIAYPEALRQNIISYNHPVLRVIIASYAAQLQKAVKRRDLVSINHRLAVLFASYFDILFAVNRQLHPGEKRQVEFAINNCHILPADMEADIASVLSLTAADISELPSRVSGLLDRLDQMLEKEEIAHKVFGYK
jgi:hypothetical protein